jgi:hypothetical protein
VQMRAGSPGVKVPWTLAGKPQERRRVPLLQFEPSTPWSPVDMSSESWSNLPHDRPALDPRLDFPREGERRRGNQDAFCPRRTRRVVGLFSLATWFARSRPLVTPLLPEGR